MAEEPNQNNIGTDSPETNMATTTIRTSFQQPKTEPEECFPLQTAEGHRGTLKAFPRETVGTKNRTSALISEQEDVRKLVEEFANRLDQSQEASSTVQSEVSTNVLLEISDLKSKVLRLTEQSTKHDGDLSFLSKMSEQVELLEDQIIKWRYRLPELTDDESKERVVSAVEVREELDEFNEVVLRKLKEFLTNLNALQESVRLIENDREESWEAISHKVSTLVEDSVESLTERLTELEHTVQSQRTTPVSDDDVLNMETWSTMEQAIWSELGKVSSTRSMHEP